VNLLFLEFDFDLMSSLDLFLFFKNYIFILYYYYLLLVVLYNFIS